MGFFANIFGVHAPVSTKEAKSIDEMWDEFRKEFEAAAPEPMEAFDKQIKRIESQIEFFISMPDADEHRCPLCHSVQKTTKKHELRFSFQFRNPGITKDNFSKWDFENRYSFYYSTYVGTHELLFFVLKDTCVGCGYEFMKFRKPLNWDSQISLARQLFTAHLKRFCDFYSSCGS